MHNQKLHYSSERPNPSNRSGSENNSGRMNQSNLQQQLQPNHPYLDIRRNSLQYLASIASSNYQSLIVPNVSGASSTNPTTLQNTSNHRNSFNKRDCNSSIPSITSKRMNTFTNPLLTTILNQEFSPNNDEYSSNIAITNEQKQIIFDTMNNNIGDESHQKRRLSATSSLGSFEPNKLSYTPLLQNSFSDEQKQRPQDHEERQKFIVFIYVLFKMIDESFALNKTMKDDNVADLNSGSYGNTIGKNIKLQASQTVKECTHSLRLGLKGYSPLMPVIKEKLQLIDGIEDYWTRASRTLDSFWPKYKLKTKRKHNKRKRGSVKFEDQTRNDKYLKTETWDHSFVAQV